MVCPLKGNKKVEGDMNVFELGDTIEYRKVKSVVRGKENVYLAAEQIVKISGIGKVTFVISKRRKDKKPNFYMSPSLDIDLEDILEMYENRWNIELTHWEANQKFGFNDYQFMNKVVIGGSIRLVFLPWTIVLVTKLRYTDDLEGIVLRDSGFPSVSITW